MPSLWQEQMDIARKLLLIICVLNGLCALVFGLIMIIVPDGSLIGMPISMLARFPWQDLFFQNFVWPGIALICVNGIPNLITAAVIVMRKKIGYIMGIACGALLIAWCVFELIFMFNFLAIIYLAVGVLQIAAGLRCKRAARAGIN